ncbi:hypothetical protein QUF64_07085 [Anaerolineales bacterium HSG6]|nr:hypothetical protein [Anaerolineales bacterium HSG6]
MSQPTLLLDTNVLWNWRYLRQHLTPLIEARRLQVYIPTIVHAERIRQYAQVRGEQFALRVIQLAITDSKFELLPFETIDAEALANIWLAIKNNTLSNEFEDVESYWQAHRLDILLCATAHARGYTLVTDDTGIHFEAIPRRMTFLQVKDYLNELVKQD